LICEQDGSDLLRRLRDNNAFGRRTSPICNNIMKTMGVGWRTGKKKGGVFPITQIDVVLEGEISISFVKSNVNFAQVIEMHPGSSLYDSV